MFFVIRKVGIRLLDVIKNFPEYLLCDSRIPGAIGVGKSVL